MILRNWISGALCFFCVLGIAATSSADTFLTATTDSSGAPVVQLRSSADGSVLASDTIPAVSEGGFLLHGSFQSNTYGLIQLNNITASFFLRSFDGAAVCNFELGKNVVRVQAVNVDSQGEDEIVVQTAGADTAQVYSSCGTLIQSVAITPSTNLLYAATSNGLQAGFVQYPKKKKDGNPSLHFNSQSLPLSGGVGQVVADTAGSSFRALVKNKKKLLAFDGSTERDLSFSVRGKDSIFQLVGTDTDTFGVGTKKGSVSIFDRNGSLLRELALTNDGRRAKKIKAPSPYPASCQGFHNIVKRAMKGLRTRNGALFISNVLTLRRTKVTKRCFVRADKPLDAALSLKRPTFNYGSSLIRLSSNSGDQKGPCSKFFKAQDGLGGFLVKNSDHVGLVYLTPKEYFNGRQLDKNTFQVKTPTQYSGLANGLRGHHRITNQTLPRPPHIFAADISPTETHCWRIPGGKTRID